MGRQNSVREKARTTPVLDRVDVLVAGGGPAGIAAALSSAREGARTALVERYGYLGGMITGAHVVAIHGVGDGYRPMARGITEEIRQRLGELGGVSPMGPPSGAEETGDQQSSRKSGEYRVDAEVFKWQAAEMLLEEGVDLLLHTLACEPILDDGCVTGVISESKSGRQAVLADVVVDATADADLAFRAGVDCDNATHEVTLGIRIEGIDREAVDAFAREHPDEYQAVTDEATRINGENPPHSERLLKGIDVADARALTRAEIQLRREAFGSLMYLRRRLPGYEDARIAETLPQIGVRQSRRIHGEYSVSDTDLRESRRFDDGIARLGVYFPDWGPIYQRKGLAYDVPYRCMLPRDIDGLLVAGRCVSSDYVACNTLRLIVPCFATGQAAGVAAAMAVEIDCPPRSVPSGLLRTALRRQDVYLG